MARATIILVVRIAMQNVIFSYFDLLISKIYFSILLETTGSFPRALIAVKSTLLSMITERIAVGMDIF